MKNFIRWRSVVRYLAGKKLKKVQRANEAVEIREASIITAAID